MHFMLWLAVAYEREIMIYVIGPFIIGINMKYTTKTIAATFAVLVQASAFALPFELWEDDLAYLLQIVKKLAIDEQALPDFYEWQDAGNFQYLLTSFPSAAVDGIDSIRLGKSKLDTIELTITDDGYDEPLGSMSVRLKPSPQKDESVKKKSMRIFSITNTSNVSVKRNWRRCLEKMPQKNIRSMMKRK